MLKVGDPNTSAFGLCRLLEYDRLIDGPIGLQGADLSDP
jgi:hypothetical protein